MLEPAYVSSVDSGNLAGHLIALANACEEWLDEPLSPAWRNGLGDTLALVRQGLDGLPVAPDIGGDYVRPWKRSRRRSMVRSPPRRAWQDCGGSRRKP